MPQDGSDVHSLEQQVAALREQLRQAQKLTALGELSSTITHEFNNVLTTIINYARLGLRHSDAETRQRSFEKILTASQRAAKMTTGILGFARNRKADFEPTDLAKLVDDTMMLLEREFTKYRVVVDRRIAAAPPALANTNQIQQVLLNLLVNARQAMPDGGRIMVQVASDPEAGIVELSVRDNGCGMSQETLHRIFDPFFTTKQGPDASGKGGTGLGLAMCRDIIETHHGRMRVESTPGKGTCFTLRLPAVRTAAPLAAPAANEIASPSTFA